MAIRRLLAQTYDPVKQRQQGLFGTGTLRESDSAHNPRDKMGLVGSNGSGKSTLMKMIAPRSIPTRAASIWPGHHGRIPSQDGVAATGRPLFDEAMSVFDELLDMEVEQHRLAIA